MRRSFLPYPCVFLPVQPEVDPTTVAMSFRHGNVVGPSTRFAGLGFFLVGRKVRAAGSASSNPQFEAGKVAKGLVSVGV